MTESSQRKELFPISPGSEGVQEDSTNTMWYTYMKEAVEYDKFMTDAWREDAKGFLVFTGLFSAVVAVFLLESYKKLSPSSGDRNAFYLQQISQQLASFTDGTSVPPQDFSPNLPTIPIIWINTMWVLSLVLSIMSALSAILIQQWARRYLQLPQIPGLASEQARVRSFLFFGAHKYGITHAVGLPPLLLHLSILLFFAGLVLFFYIVHKTIAIVLLISVGLFGVVYLALTILPCIDYHSPYRTPMSNVLWYIWQSFLSSATLCLRWLLRLLHSCFVPYNLGDVTTLRQSIITRWLQTIDDSSEKYKRHLKDGFRKTIVQEALDAPVQVDLKALTWLFRRPGLAENTKFQEFVANIPGNTIIQLMSGPVESGRIIFRDHLLTLLRSCTPGTVGLDEDMRRHRLLICLNAIQHVAKASTTLYPPSESVLRDLRTNFANIRLMRPLWADTDPSIRIVSRSICALLARHLLRKYPHEESELAWLQNVIGRSTHTIFNSLANLTAVDYMNLDAYVYGVLSRQTDDLSTKQATSFMATLTILTNTGSERVFRRSVAEGEITAFVRRADEQDNRLREVIEPLRRIFEGAFTGPPADPRISTISS
jgi:hypothetical protein